MSGPGPLLRKGFVFGLVLQHELQHQETMLQTLQLQTTVEYPVRDDSPFGDASDGPDEIRVEGDSFVLGATDEPWAYDNQLVAHELELDAFFIDRTPVTNGAFADFISHRGYSSSKHWSPEGWAWREREEIRAPLFWERSKDGWERVRFGRREPVPLDAGSARLLVRGRRLRALGGQAPPDGSRVGASGGLARASRQGSLPVGRRVDGVRGKSRPSPFLSGSGRLVRRRREPRGLPPADG